MPNPITLCLISINSYQNKSAYIITQTQININKENIERLNIILIYTYTCYLWVKSEAKCLFVATLLQIYTYIDNAYTYIYNRTIEACM